MDTQSILGQAGAPFEFEWKADGWNKPRKFTVQFRTQRVKAEFERWAKATAIAVTVAMKPHLAPDDYQARLAALEVSFQRDEYAFGSPRCEDLRQSTPGRLAMARILLGDQGKYLTHDELQDLLLDKGEELSLYMAACTSRMDAIKRDLGWDETLDPRGELLDPKELTLALKAADLW